MDRTGKIAIALALLTLFGWQWFQSKKVKEAQRLAQLEQAATPSPEAAVAPAQVANATPSPAATSTPTPASATPSVAKQEADVKSPSVLYKFTNIGGGISTAELLHHPLVEGGNVVMNEKGAEIGHKPIGAVSFQPADLPDAWEMKQEDGRVHFERTSAQQLKIENTFTPVSGTTGADEYLVNLEVRFTNLAQQPADVPEYFVHTGAIGPLFQSDSILYTGFDWFRMGSLKDISVGWFDASKIPLLGVQTKPAREFYSETADRVAWAGVKNQYFSTIISPDGVIGGGGWARRFEFHLSEENPPLKAIEGALAMSGFKLNPGESKVQKFTVYSGPREFTRLKQMKQDEDRIMNYGMFRIVSETLLSAMHWIKGKLGSYAVAIIILTIIIKTVLWPMQNKATRSAKKMQLLSPRMKELQEKYKDDPVKMQQEVGKLYKAYGVNPFSGCLPMLVTIPIFFGFFYMLGQSIELRGSGFFWVKDLSRPDTIAHVLGFPINVLPLIMAVTSFWQMALMPKSGDPVQQRMFMFMPLIFIAFCYNFASALALYYTVQNLFSIVQLYVTRNQPMPTLEKVNVAAPAKKKR